MAIGSISPSALTPSAISDSKQAQASQQAETIVLKKQLDGAGSVESNLIASATGQPPPSEPGKGNKIDLKA